MTTLSDLLYVTAECTDCGKKFTSNWLLLASTWSWQHEHSYRIRHRYTYRHDVLERWCNRCEVHMRYAVYRNTDGKGWYTLWHCPRCRRTEFLQ